ncbi:MAG: FecR domain-containing protein [Dysgonamonadaceae bacterium]|jgi:ferric-dicitrate binding protein FerR (iron transport regulator)|nr:FecR domain-containing protein [Dysgonamonadaceae bacterium]
MSRIRQIIQAYFYNRYAKIVQKKFSQWLVNDRSAEEKDAALRELWDNLQVAPEQSTKRSFRQVQRRIAARPAARRTLWLRNVRKIAAILLLPLLSSVAVYRYMQHTSAPAPAELVECFVPNGTTQAITLPDSSRVIVNAGSVLIYPQQFNGDFRTVYLNGEACFTVSPDERKPFIVKTTDMVVEVLGTVFAVSSYADSKTVSATLQSGRVSVQLKHTPTESIVLSPDEQVWYDRLSGDIKINQVNAAQVLAWKEGHIILHGSSMNDIAKILERRYGIAVYLNANKYTGERITAKFMHGENLRDFLSVLQQLIPNMKYKLDNTKLYIY